MGEAAYRTSYELSPSQLVDQINGLRSLVAKRGRRARDARRGRALAVLYVDFMMCYWPHCQTEDRVLKDRRLSRLLK